MHWRLGDVRHDAAVPARDADCDEPTHTYSHEHNYTNMDTHSDVHIYGDIYAHYPTNRHADCFPILYRRADSHTATERDADADANSDDCAGQTDNHTEHGSADVVRSVEVDASRG